MNRDITILLKTKSHEKVWNETHMIKVIVKKLPFQVNGSHTSSKLPVFILRYTKIRLKY